MPKSVKAFYWIAVVPIFFLFFLFSLNVSAEENSVVRVGYYEDGDYMYCNEQGEYEGYNF